jgi:hypothetical protein
MRSSLSILCFTVFYLLLASNASAQYAGGSTNMNATVKGMLGVFPQYGNVLVPEDYYFYLNLTVYQNHPLDVLVYLNKSDTNGFVKFQNQSGGMSYYQDNYAFLLPGFGDRNVTLRIYVPPSSGYDGGTYDITFYSYSLDDNRLNSTSLQIHVNTTNPIDDIEITGIRPSALYQGQVIEADISVHKITPLETTDVQICYCINSDPAYLCGPSYNNYGCAWKAIAEWLNYTKSVAVNENTGSYYFIAALKYPNDENIKRAVSPLFYVLSSPPPRNGGGGTSGAIIPQELPRPDFAIISPNYLEAFPGEELKFSVEVKNTGNSTAYNTSLQVYGITSNWVLVAPTQQDIKTGESKNFFVAIKLPDSAIEQLYSLSLVAKSGTSEVPKVVALGVSRSTKNRAKFMLEEAVRRKSETHAMLNWTNNFGLEVPGSEKNMSDFDSALDAAMKMFASGDYNGTMEKSKQAMNGYDYVTETIELVLNAEYFRIMQDMSSDMIKAEAYSEEKDVLKTVNEMVFRSITLKKENRFIDAYVSLLEAKKLLEQLMEKIYFKELSRSTVIVSIIIVVLIALSMIAFYNKKISKLLRAAHLEEQKNNLKAIFRKEIGYADYNEEGPPQRRDRTADAKDKIDNMRGFLRIGESLVETDMDGAKDAYEKANHIYNSLSYEERKLAGEEYIRLKRLYNKIMIRKLR